VGGGTTGIELALALRHRLRQAPVSLVTGARGLAPGQPAALRGKAAELLHARGVTVLPDRVSAIGPDELKLESGARLACDVALMATPVQAPTWLQASGLALDAQARLAVNACLRSDSHRNVFACGETCGGAAGTGQGRYGRSSGPTLLHNLGAALAGREPRPLKTPHHELHLLSASQGTALACWGELCVQGRWVDSVKDRLDRPG
jgi:selenide,water dikinase